MKTTFRLLIVLAVVSAAGADYSIPWHTIDGGGGVSTGGSYTLTATVAQPDAGYLSGGSYDMLGGFWGGGPLCIVNLEHFAAFAAHWLDGPCDAGNNFCNGADLNQANDVDIVDLTILGSEWLNICPGNWTLH